MRRLLLCLVVAVAAGVPAGQVSALPMAYVREGTTVPVMSAGFLSGLGKIVNRIRKGVDTPDVPVVPRKSATKESETGNGAEDISARSTAPLRGLANSVNDPEMAADAPGSTSDLWFTLLGAGVILLAIVGWATGAKTDEE